MPDPNGRRRPSKLSAETKWEIFLQVTAGEISQAEAARKAHRRIDGDRDTAHGQGRRLGRAGTQTRTTWHATRLAVGSGTGGDRAADRGGQGAGDRAVGRAGKIRLGLSGPVPARVPADVKEAVLKSVDDAVAAGLAHTWVCGLWQVSDPPFHPALGGGRAAGAPCGPGPGGR